MFTRLLRPRSRIGDLGMALAGFGLFFIGIDLMKTAFEGFAADFDLAALSLDGFFGLVIYVALGVMMTVLTQSSSAAIAITLTAATGGVLSIDAAAATVIGANVGTTSTAALAVIGATANARRVAAAHVVFNLMTGLVALILLPLVLWLVRATGEFLGLQDAPAVTLALFHTTFNILGVALMWPWTTRMAAFLQNRFTTQAERLSKPQFLDSNVLEAPDLALEALNREILRTFAMTRDLVARSLAPGPAGRELQEQRVAIDGLCDETAKFVTRVHSERLPQELRDSTPRALRVLAYIEEITGLLDDYNESRDYIRAIAKPGVADRIESYQRAVVGHVMHCDPSSAEIAEAGLQPDYLKLRDEWRSLKVVLLEAATRGAFRVDNLNLAIEGLRALLRIAEQSTKAVARLRELTQRQRGLTHQDDR
jgi:phosphate:Na+ symporter